MITFEDILQVSNDKISYETSGKGHIKLVGQRFPYSILEKEFEYIYHTIVNNKLKTGVEISTGTGVSGLAASLAFKETHGKLLSIDAYIEEHYDDPVAYEYKTNETYPDSNCYQSALLLSEHFQTTDHVSFRCGWSPTDVPQLIQETFGESALIDYLFIDGGHFTEQIKHDFGAVCPYLHSKSIVLFHDNYFSEDLMNFLQTKTKLEIKIVIPHPDGENLSIMKGPYYDTV